MSDHMLGQTPGRSRIWYVLSGLAWLRPSSAWLAPLSPRTCVLAAVLIAGFLGYYFWVSEGAIQNILFTVGITAALGSVVLLLTGRLMFSVALVSAFCALIATAASAKHATMNMVVHAYDLFFYLSSLSTLSFLAGEYPLLVLKAVGAFLAFLLIGWMTYRLDSTRIRGTRAFLAWVIAIGIGTYGWAGKGERRHMQFYFENLYVSSFYASWGETLETLWNGTMLEAASNGPTAQPPLTIPQNCSPAGKPPHIVLVHQESVVPPAIFPSLSYDRSVDSMFKSHDGALHKMRVETYGGASWLTEFSILTGVSTQAFGGMRQFVQTFMVNRLADTLPQRLEQCGYRNVVFYPMLRNFVSNDKFYASVGLKEIFDLKAQKAKSTQERDRFYYANALDEMERHVKSSTKPLFTYIQTMSAHWPYDWTFEPNENVPGGGPGTYPEMSEYLRRVSLAKRDWDYLMSELKNRFPGERIVVVSYGDHQPAATRTLIGYKHETDLEDIPIDIEGPGFITYFAVDGINYQPPPLPAHEITDVPYLATLIQDAARLPLSDANKERLKLMERCQGRYYTCAKKTDVLAFHRRLIDAGIIVAR